MGIGIIFPKAGNGNVNGVMGMGWNGYTKVIPAQTFGLMIM